MSTLVVELHSVLAESVEVTNDTLVVDLNDGRTLSVPLTWYPRLLYGTVAERANWRWIGNGEGVHWPDLDEDISIQHLLLGKSSQESQISLSRWLQGRTP